jgi:chromate reductase, NAD(P)H dehydrogenase (quinone)
MQILAISGSLRRDSHNTTLLRAAAELLPPEMEVVIYEGLAAIPNFNEDDVATRPVAAQDLWDAAEQADGVLISTPEYNHSIPGVLKNALDWVSTPFPNNVLRGKPVAVIGASTGGYGGMWAQAELRKVLGLTGARVVNGDLSLARAHEHFDQAGTLAAPHGGRLSQVLDTLLAEVQPVAA